MEFIKLVNKKLEEDFYKRVVSYVCLGIGMLIIYFVVLPFFMQTKTVHVEGQVTNNDITMTRYNQLVYVLIVREKDESIRTIMVTKDVYVNYPPSKDISISCTYHFIYEADDPLNCRDVYSFSQ